MSVAALPGQAAGFDLRDAYQGTEAGMRRLDQMLTTLSSAITRYQEREPNSLADQGTGQTITDSAKAVQQMLLGNLRQPEPTNQYKAIAADGPEAQAAMSRLNEAASRFARRDQLLTMLPSSLTLGDANGLDRLQQAITDLRAASPSLAKAAPGKDKSPLETLLENPSPSAMDQFFAPHAARLEAAAESMKPKQDAPQGKRIIEELAPHILLSSRTLPAIRDGLQALASTQPLLDVADGLRNIKSGEERLRYAATAIDGLTRPAGNDPLAGVLPTSNGGLILPGSAKGEAAKAAGVLISTDLEAELRSAVALTERMKDRDLPNRLERFAQQHRALSSRIDSLFPDGETPDGQLVLSFDRSGQKQVELTERAELGRMLVARERMDALMKKQPTDGPEALAAVEATAPGRELELINLANKERLGDGYRGVMGWRDPVARLALDIEISATATAMMQEPNRHASSAMLHAGLDTQALDKLKDKATVERLINRFPDTAAKLPEATSFNLQKPDLAAMGIELPKPKAPNQAPGIILPGPGLRR